MNIKIVRQKIADLQSASNAILADVEKAGGFTDEQRKQLDNLEAQMNEDKADEGRLLKVLEREKAAPSVEERTPEEKKAAAVREGKAFNGLGDMLLAVYRAGINAGVDPRLVRAAASGASENVPSDGGYLVGTDVDTTLLKRVYSLGQISSRVRRIPISANNNGLRMYGVSETSRVTGSRYGGVQGYWLAEADTKTGSKPKLREIEMRLHKLAALFYSTDELLQDSTALEALVMQAIPEELNFLVEAAILEGTGAGQPQGLLNSAAKIAVNKESGQDAATIVFENIVKMYSRMWAGSVPNAVWFVNQDCMPQLMQMSLKVGTGGAPAWMNAGSIAGMPYNTLMGRPVIPVEYAATLGTEGDIMFLDLSQYMMIDKGGIQSASSIHVKFETDQTVFRFVYRVDGQSSWNSAVTPFKGSSTQSPFITLQTRS